MISELIKFADTVGYSDIPQKEVKNQIIVIDTVTDGKNIGYKSYRIINEDEKISEFLKEVSDIEYLPADPKSFRNWLYENKQPPYKDHNKGLGGSQGLGNSIPFIFELTEKNRKDFQKKLNTGLTPTDGWKSNPELQDELTENLKEIYEQFWEKFEKSNIEIGDGEDPICVILMPTKYREIAREEIYRMFIADRKTEVPNKKFSSNEKNNCPICREKDTLYAPVTYQDKKPFLKRSDRPNPYESLVCAKCCVKVHDAIEMLRKRQFRLFPIFHVIDRTPVMTHDDGTALTFREAINEVPATENGTYDFYLVGLSGKNAEIWLYDYISGYKKNIGTMARFEAESIMWTDIIGKKKPAYFDELTGLNGNTQGYAQSIRDKIFQLVYRGDDSAVTKEDTIHGVVLRIKDEIYNTKNPEGRCKKIVESSLKLFKVLRWGSAMAVSKEDQNNAEELGKAYRTVVELSEAGNKHLLLSPGADKPMVEGVQQCLANLVHKYKHKFNELEKEDETLIGNALEAKYETKEFNKLKMYFYAGYFLNGGNEE